MLTVVKELFEDFFRSPHWLGNSEKIIYEWIFYGMISVPVILFFMIFAIAAALFFVGLCLALILDLILRLIYFKFKRPSYLLYTGYLWKEKEL